MSHSASPTTGPLTDSFGRHVHYLRLSVTDRCDFRCVYCMAEDMTFLPRSQVLSLEELAEVAEAFHSLGVDKIRITGGEPLVRKDILTLFERLGALGLEDLSLTTNGVRLPRYAQELVACGVRRVNISLDSLQPERFSRLTRTGKLQDVLAGIDAAQAAGFERVKLNTVMMKHHNADELLDLTRFALARGLDLSFIEEMPLGEITSHEREAEFVSSNALRERLARHYELRPITEKSGGPSRYWQAHGHASRIGFISPHSENFCASCNRVRLSAEGRLLLCLGNEHSVDLKSVLRDQPQSASPEQRLATLQRAIVDAMPLKPEKHHFDLGEQPQILRFMNATGG